MLDQLSSQIGRTVSGLRVRARRMTPRRRRVIGLIAGLVAAALLGVVALLPRMTSAAEVNVLGNGGFEHGFYSVPGCGDVGVQWGCFTNGGAANYGFYDDQWAPVVAEGKHSQLIEINTFGFDAPSNDRYAGIYQTAKVVPGARYKLSLRGVIRTTNMEGDPWRYVVQVGWLDGPHGDWREVKNWTDTGWYTYYPRTEPGSISHFQTTVVPNSGAITVFVRVWKKWGMAYEELDVNLDDIALVGPAYHAPIIPFPGIGGPVMPGGPAVGGPVYGGPAIGGPVYGGPSYGGPVGGGHGPVAPSLPPADQSAVCGGPDYVYNGSFEQGFNSTALGDVGKGWGAFTNGGAAAYGFYQEQWDVVVADGKNGQLIEINTKRIYPPDADRYAGIYQRIGGLHPGATYELSLRGLLRGEGNEQEPYRFAAQWGISHEADWRTVKEWTEMDLGDIYQRTQPGPMALYKARFTAPGPNVVLFIRAWNKWAVTDVELDFNVDAIKVVPCHPSGPSHGYGGPVGPGVGGPVGPGSGGPVGGACVYTVKPGDMLSRIAQRYGVTAAAIAQANGIRNPNMIYAGQQLTIPGCGGGPAAGPVMPSAVPVARPAAGPVQGTGPMGGPAMSGPAMSGPASGGPVMGGPATRPPAGRPGAVGATAAPAQAASGPGRPAGGAQTTYTVQRGDSLSMIALWYGVDVQRLAAANGIRNTNMIYVGQVLVIPGN